MSERLRMEADHTVHCSGPDCELHQHVGNDTWEDGRLPVGWVRVTRYWDNGEASEGAFHNYECLMQWCAGQEPPEVVR